MTKSTTDEGRVGLRWLVGVDAHDLGAGAVAFARWAAARAPRDRFLALHVFEQSWREHLSHLDDPEGDYAEADAEAIVEPLRRDETFTGVRTIASTNTLNGLSLELGARRCDAMIVGRRKPADRSTLVRLGKVARRLLRALPGPVVVVPPDLAADSLRPGPILVGTDLRESSVGAARFAVALAASLDLDVLVTYVDPLPDELPRLAPRERRLAVLERSRVARARALTQWVADHGLADARTSVVDGSPATALQEVAKLAGAPIIVVGSRVLGLVDRIVVSSVGSELAANAPIPVAVVPPTWQGATGERDPSTPLQPAEAPTSPGGLAVADVLDLPVEAIMTRDPTVVHVDERVSVARAAMLATGGHHVPVIDRGRLVGLLTSGDLLRAAKADAHAMQPQELDAVLDHVSIRSAMHEDVLTIAPGHSVREACGKLAGGGFHGLPVVDDDGRLVGLLTTTDILKALLG